MSYLRKFAYAIGGFTIVLLLIGLLLPGTAQVERSIEIAAPSATVFALVNDPQRINEWSPWAAADPNAVIEYSGAQRGESAQVSWQGQIVGSGRQQIVTSEPYVRVASEIDLGGHGTASTRFELEEVEIGTRVTWVFENKFGFNLAARYFGLLMDGMIGSDFEAGLVSLKRMAERLPAADFSDIEIRHDVVAAFDIAFVSTHSEPEADAIAAALGAAYFKVLNFIDTRELRNSGSPMSIGGEFSGARLLFKAAIPVRGDIASVATSGSGVQLGRSYAGAVIWVEHTGPYRTLGATHDKIAAYLAAHGMQRNGDSWESYVDDPTRVSEAELRTFVYYPVIE